MLWIASASANASESVRLRVVAQSGEVAPSGYGHNLSSFKFDELLGATINDRGDIAYFALTDHRVDGFQRGGVWMDPIHTGQPNKFPGILDDVLAPDDALGRRFSGVQLPILSDGGMGLATEFYTDRDEGSGVYLATDHYFGPPLLIPGDQAPSLPPGELVVTATGELFTSSGIGLISAYTNRDVSGLWRFSGENLQLIAVNRSSIPQLPGFQYTGTALRGKINDLGDALVNGSIDLPPNPVPGVMRVRVG